MTLATVTRTTWNASEVASSHKTFLKFRVPSGFSVDVPNCRFWPKQSLGQNVVAYTGNRTLIRTIKGPWKGQVKVLSERARLDTAPLSELSSSTGKRILFVLPGNAVGDNVGYFLFLQSVLEALAPSRVAVMNSGGASDIYHLDSRIEVFPLWIEHAELRGFDLVVDFMEVPRLRKIAESPCDPEVTLTDFADLPPTKAYSTAPRQSGKPASVSIFPLASSPMRSLPLDLCRFLIGKATQSNLPVAVHLNGMQRQSAFYERGLQDLESPTVKLHRGSSSLGDLFSVMENVDYGIFCDSGPAHLSKLTATRGIAVHTSAEAGVLRGRFTNLGIWQSNYVGKYCAAPCGLAGPWVDAAGRIGCMGSLTVPRSELKERAILVDEVTNRAMIEHPIPCVDHLNHTKQQIWEAIETSWSL